MTRVYHISLRDGHATIVARSPEDALEELRTFDFQCNLVGALVRAIAPDKEIAISYEDDDDIEELYDTFLGISRQLKPGFTSEVDEEGDHVVVASAGAWAKAFEDTAPHIISSYINNK